MDMDVLVRSKLWKILTSKRCLVVIVIYVIFIHLLMPYLSTEIPQDCFTFNKTSYNHKCNISAKIDVYLKAVSNKQFLNGDNVAQFKGWSRISHDTFIYSAYIDKCPSAINSLSFCVIFIGITLTNYHELDSSSFDINCAVKHKSNVLKIGLAITKILPEHHFKLYSAAIFYCNLESFVFGSLWPDHATLYESSPSNWLTVQYYTSKKFNSNVVASLCVRPLYGSISNMQLLEFLAYYSTMGVEHFTFYNQNVSESAIKFLKFINSINISIEILPWGVPLANDLIHEYGQIIFTQDCIYRSKYRFSHTFIVDLDEFIVPKLHSNIPDLLSYLDYEYENAGSYTIPMVLFCKEFSHIEQYFSLFHIFNSNKRQNTFWAHGFRSKYITRPERVQYSGVHIVWEHTKNWFEVKVSGSVALLHHYRQCCGMKQTWILHLFSFYVLNDDIVVDNSLIKFKDNIINHTLVQYILNVTNSTILCM